MPIKDLEQRRKYAREWLKKDRENNIEKYRAIGRRSSKKYRENRPDLYQKRIESIRDRYTKLKHRCKRKNFVLELTLDEYSNIIKDGLCHYCGNPLSKTGSGLDRINNEPSYAFNNVVACCVRCNRVFNLYFNYNQKLLLAEAIRKCDLITEL